VQWYSLGLPIAGAYYESCEHSLRAENTEGILKNKRG